MIDVREYARALFLIGEEDGNTEEVLAQLKAVDELIRKEPAYVTLLDTPAVSKAEKLGLLDEAFGSLNKNLLNFLKILSERHHVYALTKILLEYSALYDEARGIVRVDAVTALGLTGDQNAALKKKLEGMLSKTVIINNIVDPSVLGGVKLRYSGIQVDGTVKARIDGFAARLKDLVV